MPSIRIVHERNADYYYVVFAALCILGQCVGVDSLNGRYRRSFRRLLLPNYQIYVNISRVGGREGAYSI